MHIHKFVYNRKSQSISYLDVHRNAGHTVEHYHMHDHEEIVLIDRECMCKLTNNGNAVHVKAPAILLNRAGTFHETEHVEQDYHAQVIFFHPENLQGLPEELRFEPLFRSDMYILPLTAAQTELFQPLFALLRDRPMGQKRPLLLCILSQMLQLVQEGLQPIATAAHHTYVFDVIETIHATTGQFTAAELADRFHVSQSKLKKDFKEITGVSVAVFCRRVRLQKAQAMLESTSLDLAQIAEKCGFSDESYFIESFRKTYGTTPGAYRREH